MRILIVLILFAVFFAAILLTGMSARSKPTPWSPAPGHYATVKTTGDLVVMVAWDQTTWPRACWCRIDHGPGTLPRYEEHLFHAIELGPVAEGGK